MQCPRLHSTAGHMASYANALPAELNAIPLTLLADGVFEPATVPVT